MNTNTSYAFTGVYVYREIVHTFQNGVYTININGTKEPALSAENIEKQQPEEG